MWQVDGPRMTLRVGNLASPKVSLLIFKLPLARICSYHQVSEQQKLAFTRAYMYF